MPGMSGTEFLGKLRRLHPSALRIAISGADDAETVASAVNEAGIHNFLLKEWTSERLYCEVLEAYLSVAAARVKPGIRPVVDAAPNVDARNEA